MLEHFRFLAANSKVTPKMTVPAPANLHFRNGRKTISKEVYPDLGAVLRRCCTTYGKVIKAFYDAGCRYLQLDDTTWGYLCSAEERALAKTRGDDNVDELPAIYAEITNRALASKPADIGGDHAHLPRQLPLALDLGGRLRAGGRALLGGTNYDGYFMEWDTDRAGGLEPLRFLPKGKKRVVVGLVTSKTGALESKDDIKRRLDEAPRMRPWTSSACRHNAASPRPRKATTSPRSRMGQAAAGGGRGARGVGLTARRPSSFLSRDAPMWKRAFPALFPSSDAARLRCRQRFAVALIASFQALPFSRVLDGDLRRPSRRHLISGPSFRRVPWLRRALWAVCRRCEQPHRCVPIAKRGNIPLPGLAGRAMQQNANTRRKPMHRPRTLMWTVLGGALAVLGQLTVASVQAQNFPTKPVTMIVPWPAGGSTDLAMRALADATQKHLGQPIVIENRAGASGTLGPAQMAATAKPDGYTIAQMPITVFRLPFMHEDDLRSDQGFHLHHRPHRLHVRRRGAERTRPWKTFQEMLAVRQSQSRQDQVRHARRRHQPAHRHGADRQAGRRQVDARAVQGRGRDQRGAARRPRRCGRRFDRLGRAGQLRRFPPAGDLGPTRTKNWPDVPTLKELGINLVAQLALRPRRPEGHGPEVVKVLHDAFKKGLEEPAYASALKKFDQELAYLNTADYAKHVAGSRVAEGQDN